MRLTAISFTHSMNSATVRYQSFCYSQPGPELFSGWYVIYRISSLKELFYIGVLTMSE